MRLSGYSGKESPRVASPASIGTLVIRYERPRELFNVVGVADLLEQIPLG